MCLANFAIQVPTKRLLDLNPAEKREAKLKKAQELQRQEAVQDQQSKELQRLVQRQGGRSTPQQQLAHQELIQRRMKRTSRRRRRVVGA